jgi:hypothetical protein
MGRVGRARGQQVTVRARATARRQYMTRHARGNRVKFKARPSLRVAVADAVPVLPLYCTVSIVSPRSTFVDVAITYGQQDNNPYRAPNQPLSIWHHRSPI